MVCVCNGEFGGPSPQAQPARTRWPTPAAHFQPTPPRCCPDNGAACAMWHHRALQCSRLPRFGGTLLSAWLARGDAHNQPRTLQAGQQGHLLQSKRRTDHACTKLLRTMVPAPDLRAKLSQSWGQGPHRSRSIATKLWTQTIPLGHATDVHTLLLIESWGACGRPSAAHSPRQSAVAASSPGCKKGCPESVGTIGGGCLGLKMSQRCAKCFFAVRPWLACHFFCIS